MCEIFFFLFRCFYKYSVITFFIIKKTPEIITYRHYLVIIWRVTCTRLWCWHQN